LGLGQKLPVSVSGIGIEKRVFTVAWANAALRLGIRTCRGFEFSIPKPRFVLVKYLIRFLHEENYFWHEKRLKSAFFRALKDKSIFYHGHRDDVVNSTVGADSSSDEERRRVS
jgi:hypothetical protein